MDDGPLVPVGLTAAAEARLAEIRTLQTKRGAPRDTVMAVVLAISLPVTLTTGLWPAALVASGGLYWLATEGRRRWMLAFDGQTHDRGWWECQLYQTARGTLVRYRTQANQHHNERLVITVLGDVVVGPREPRILDPVFDARLGVRTNSIGLALLGPTLRERLPGWVDASLVAIDGNEMRVRIDETATGYDPIETMRALDALDAYSARLRAPTREALIAMAQAVEHPFDAARALAVLHATWPDLAAEVARDLPDTASTAAIEALVVDGAALTDLTVPWLMRSTIARGVLGARGPTAARIANEIDALAPPTVPAAMALLELVEAARPGLPKGEFAASEQAARALIDAGAGPEHLDWLRERAARNRAERTLLKRVSARLEAERGGLLSLGAGTAGGLSETRAGEISVVETSS